MERFFITNYGPRLNCGFKTFNVGVEVYGEIEEFFGNRFIDYRNDVIIKDLTGHLIHIGVNIPDSVKEETIKGMPVIGALREPFQIHLPKSGKYKFSGKEGVSYISGTEFEPADVDRTVVKPPITDHRHIRVKDIDSNDSVLREMSLMAEEMNAVKEDVESDAKKELNDVEELNTEFPLDPASMLATEADEVVEVEDDSIELSQPMEDDLMEKAAEDIVEEVEEVEEVKEVKKPVLPTTKIKNKSKGKKKKGK